MAGRNKTLKWEIRSPRNKTRLGYEVLKLVKRLLSLRCPCELVGPFQESIKWEIRSPRSEKMTQCCEASRDPLDSL